jgi:peptidoglycan/xylan/chitin deacetylase (PgdA/CDA1 family)
MGRALGHVLVTAALVVSTACLLQTDDSVQTKASPRVPAVQPAVVQVARADTSGREYFIRRHEIVPLGTSTIQLPILMYHYIRPMPSAWDQMGYRLSVSPEVFKAQLDWLSAHGYHAVNFARVRAYFAGTQALPPRPFIITLDDGYRDLYTAAFPILRAHGFTAVAYIVTSFVGQDRYVSREQILDMDRAGIEIASHTVHHADLSRTSWGNTANELALSKQWLEQLVGHPVLDFAYPSGKFNAQSIQAVRQAGYDTAVTTQTSVNHSMFDRYVWGRVRVGGGESMEEFISNLGASMKSVTVSSVNIKSGG